MMLRPPAEIRRRADGHRVLAWMPSGTSTVIATDDALLLPAGSEPDSIPWHLVLRLVWNPDSIEVTSQATAGGRPETHRIAVAEPFGAMPEVVRERVTASIVVQEHVPLVGERGARLVARRTPGSDELRWSVVFDVGLDAADPALREQADAALADLRAALGV